MGYRKRTKSSLALKSDYSWTNGLTRSSASASLMNSATSIDAVHKVQGLGSGNIGGDFDLTSTTYFPSPANTSFVRQTGGAGTYYGTVVPTGLLYANFDQVAVSVPSEYQLVTLGSTAIARTMPTNPVAALSTAVGELRSDGLPKLPSFELIRERSRYLRNSGSEYLNVEFGWLPLVSDLKSFAYAVKHSHEILSNYRKGSDKKIRRRYAFPTEIRSQMLQAGDGQVTGEALIWPHTNANNKQYGKSGRHLRTVSVDTWFSGAFRYHIPGGDDLASNFSRYAQEADKLLGLELSPEVVWNLTPWTWALDWFSNAGDVVHNINRMGHDGLVLQYGYIMSSKVQTDEVWCLQSNGRPCSLRTETKNLRRRGATPYGFGFDLTKLSPSQDAILVALGLSHGLR